MNARRIWVLLFLLLLGMASGLDRNSANTLLSQMRTESGLSLAQLILMVSMFFGPVYLICLIPAGAIVDRHGGKIAAGIGVAVWSVATLLSGVAPVGWFLGVTHGVSAIGIAMTFPACNSIVREWFPASERGRAATAFYVAATLGPAISVVGIIAIADRFGWRAALFALGGVGLVLLAGSHWLFGTPEQVGWLNSAERGKILAERDGGVDAAKAGHPAGRMSYLLSTRTIWGLFLAQVCLAWGNSMLFVGLPPYLRSAKEINLFSAPSVTATSYGAAAALAVLIGWISDRSLTVERRDSGRRRLLLAGLLVVPAIVVVIPLMNDLWTISAVMTVARAAGATAGGLVLALITDLVRNRSDIGRATGIVIFGGTLVGMFAPAAIGNFMSSPGNHVAGFALAGILPVCAGIVVLTMTRGPVDTTEPRPMPAARGGAVGTAFARYAIFYGRASRSEFWWFFLFCTVCDLVAELLIRSGNVVLGVPAAIAYFGTILPLVAVTVRRLHDIDRSGWWYFFGMIPIVGWIALLIWLCTPGERSTNRFGESPLPLA